MLSYFLSHYQVTLSSIFACGLSIMCTEGNVYISDKAFSNHCNVDRTVPGVNGPGPGKH